MPELISVAYELAGVVTVIPVKSQTGPISSTMGKLVWAIQELYAEMENSEKSESIKAGQARARATAVRVSELTGIRAEDVDMAGCKISIELGKGGQDRYILFSEFSNRSIRRGLLVRSRKLCTSSFINASVLGLSCFLTDKATQNHQGLCEMMAEPGEPELACGSQICETKTREALRSMPALVIFPVQPASAHSGPYQARLGKRRELFWLSVAIKFAVTPGSSSESFRPGQVPHHPVHLCLYSNDR
jgi:hypothetical protein